MECHECGATISDRAADCPQCGASVRDLSGESETGEQPDAGGAGDTQHEGDAGSSSVTDSESGSAGPTVPGTGTDRPDADNTATEDRWEAARPPPAEREADDDFDPVEAVKRVPSLSASLAGAVTAVALAVLSVAVAVFLPGSRFDPVTLGGLVLLDLHFATSTHVTTAMLTTFETARPPDSTLGILYLFPPIFLYTAAKFVVAYNIDEETPLPLAGLAGALVAVGYFPAVLVALFLAPGGPASPVNLPAAILLAGLAYPVFFGGLGGLAAGAFSGSERRIGTLYGVVAFFLIAIGAFVVTVPALVGTDFGLLPQVHASLFTVVAVNGFSLGNTGTTVLVLLAYPLVAGTVFAAGFLRAWNADDVEEPLRGVAKGLTPVATYFTLLGLLATVLPLLADPWVVRELGFGAMEAALVQGPVGSELATIGRYVTVVFVGTLVYPVLLGGTGGAVAGGMRYALSDGN